MRRKNPFSDMMTDSITVILKDGSKHENIPALVDKENITMDEVTIPLSIGDRIERKLPSGQVEVLTVTKVHLTKGSGGRSGIPDFYEIEYESEGVQKHPVQPAPVNIHVSDSPQTRVNVNSTDHSANIINNQAEDVFSQIRELLTDALANSNELDLLLERVDDMERSRESGNFTRAYNDFIAAAAAHLTVLVPVLPALTALLMPAGGNP